MRGQELMWRHFASKLEQKRSDNIGDKFMNDQDLTQFFCKNYDLCSGNA